MQGFSAVEDLLNEAVTSGLIPGAVASVGRGGDTLYRFHSGYAAVHGGLRPMQEDTLFDVASLTKVMATLPALLILVERGRLSFEKPLSEYFPDFSQGIKQKVRVLHLVIHTSGIKAPKPFLWEIFNRSEDIISAILSQPLDIEPGTTIRYSDIGYILLGDLIEHITGKPLNEFVQDEVFGPLDMNDTSFNPQSVGNIAATEVCQGKAKVGIVHDKTAEAMGGVAGHAGIFSTEADVSRYLMMWADETGPLGRGILDEAVQSKTRGMNGNRGWGWVLRGDTQDISGDSWPDTVASHTGFTGTSVIFDRPSRTWACLLTNRVHFGRQVNISGLRRRFHDAVGAVVFN